MTRLHMSLTLAIIVSWVAVLGVWLITLGPLAQSDGDSESELPFSYTVAPEDIQSIQITHEGVTQSWFYRDDHQLWFFADMPDIPVSLYRWGGITTLLSGPKAARILEEEVAEEASGLYGLNDPDTSITLTLRDGKVQSIKLGDQTPDGNRHYSSIEGTENLVLIDATWGQVLNRLVDDPPYPDWLYSLNPNQVREIILFKDNIVVGAYGRDREEGGWRICEIPVQEDPCIGETEADGEFVVRHLQLIAEGRVLGLERADLTSERQLSEYGATLESPYIRLRVEMVREDGVIEVTGVTFNFGRETEDGEAIYAVLNETSDVVRLDKEWAREILKVFDDPIQKAVSG